MWSYLGIGLITLSVIVMAILWANRELIIDQVMKKVVPLVANNAKVRDNMIGSPFIQTLLGGMGGKRSEARLTGTDIIIDYSYRGKEYTIQIPCSKFKHKITSATLITTDGQANDVTKALLAYTGPLGDFCGIQYRPDAIFRNAKSLRVAYADSETRTYVKNEF